MNQSRRSSSLCIELGDAILDLDLSLVDRISRLLAYVPKKNLKTDPQSHASLIAELRKVFASSDASQKDIKSLNHFISF